MAHNADREKGETGHAPNDYFNTPPKPDDSGSTAAAVVGETGSQPAVDPSIEMASGSVNNSLANSLLPVIQNHTQETIAENGEIQKIKDRSPLEPPVTKTTLGELDVNKIVYSPEIRHDINFDPDLHLKANLDGEKGRRKTQKADKFWETMRIQLRDYLINREQFEKDLGGEEWCLPATLKAIKGILETLVSQRDRLSVEETFNIEFLMQQFRKGVADLPKLALWLSHVLKRHCAPMRDTWVDGIVTDISRGDQEGDVSLLVLGIRNLTGYIRGYETCEFLLSISITILIFL